MKIKILLVVSSLVMSWGWPLSLPAGDVAVPAPPPVVAAAETGSSLNPVASPVGQMPFGPPPAVADRTGRQPLTRKGGHLQAATLVGPEAQISDFDARLALARSLSYIDELHASLVEYSLLAAAAPENVTVRRERGDILVRLDRWEEALPDYEAVLKGSPQDRQGRLAVGRIYLRQGRHAEAAAVFKLLIGQGVDDPAVFLDLADAEAARGHAVACRDIYEKLLKDNVARREILRSYAGRMYLWGDYYRMERIYLDARKQNPDDTGLLFDLAGVYVASQRYEEGEGIYRRLLRESPQEAKALTGLAVLKLREKDFAAALSLAERVLKAKPADPQGRLLQGEALAGLKHYEEGASAYQAITGDPQREISGLLQAGKIFREQGDEARAQRCFAQAGALAPLRREHRFYSAGRQRVQEPEYLRTLLEKEKGNPQGLKEWGDLYAAERLLPQARSSYEAALAADPAYFPAQASLAEVLGAMGQYEASLAAYQELLREFPEAVKLLMGRARVLSWARNYQESIALYEEIGKGNPQDPVPVRELARVSLWDKRFEAAMMAYDALLKTTIADPSARSRIQKATELEKQAKILMWNRRFTRSLGAYESLLGFSPGNEEGWFDYAQVQCALGLCDEEGKSYRELLHLDPFHTLAAEALERQQQRRRPALQGSHSYWHEEGYGDLARIARNRTDLNLDFPFFCNYRLRLTGHHWEEQPDYTGNSYGADGFSVAADGVFNPYLRGSIRWTHKVYRDSSFASRETGQAELSLNLRDAVRIGAGYERSDELYNYFGIRRGTQADQGWVSVVSPLTRKVEVGGRLRYLRYNDDNDAKMAFLSGSYSFTDHPRHLKIILSGEYRDTAKTNSYIYDAAGSLTDIIHPYWAPQNYYGTALTLEWYHDISRKYYCGGELHFYDLRVSVGADTNGNPSLRGEGEWHYEFAKHWLIGLTGMIHQSSQWKARSLWGTLKYRF